QVKALLSVVRDATAQQQVEAELARTQAEMTQQREQLTRANGHLENFVYTVAHDLRAPVGNLSVLINLLLERPHDDESQLLMEHMHQSLRQLENTIADLVEVLEVQSTFKVITHQLALEQAYADVKAELSTDFAAADAVVETDFSALPEIVYIRSYLQSILRNLLSNALKYRAPGRPLRIQVRSWREDGFAVLAVEDNGLGMDLLTHGHKLFRPFSRLTTQANGKGIGLHLVQNIVQRNGGHIRADSQLGVGTTFTCFLREYEQ
ncbi:MAG TPA: ATP-binding protein, partial [Hymenobacter sp.]|nr:ATP-binding protein [Hymenobacter sp.]